MAATRRLLSRPPKGQNCICTISGSLWNSCIAETFIFYKLLSWKLSLHDTNQMEQRRQSHLIWLSSSVLSSYWLLLLTEIPGRVSGEFFIWFRDFQPDSFKSDLLFYRVLKLNGPGAVILTNVDKWNLNRLKTKHEKKRDWKYNHLGVKVINPGSWAGKVWKKAQSPL